MNPQEKKFVIILSVITLACSTGLYFWSSAASTRYDNAKASYDEVSAEITRYNNLALTPTLENIDKKTSNIKEYEVQSNKLIAELRKYGSEPVKETDDQIFKDKLVKEVAECKEAFKDIPLPDGFMLGFDKYADTLALKGSTGILTYELDAVSQLTRALAAAKPTSLLSLYREPLAEESSKQETLAKDAIYRALPIELAFTGSENSLRTLLDSIQKSDTYFYMIRSMRITNEKQTPPLASEASFESATETAASEEKASDSPFGAFTLPEETTDGAADNKDAEQPAAPEAVVSEPILKEVLGAENIKVFMRIDIVRFNPAETPNAPKKPVKKP